MALSMQEKSIDIEFGQSDVKIKSHGLCMYNNFALQSFHKFHRPLNFEEALLRSQQDQH